MALAPRPRPRPLLGAAAFAAEASLFGAAFAAEASLLGAAFAAEASLFGAALASLFGAAFAAEAPLLFGAAFAAGETSCAEASPLRKPVSSVKPSSTRLTSARDGLCVAKNLIADHISQQTRQAYAIQATLSGLHDWVAWFYEKSIRNPALPAMHLVL